MADPNVVHLFNLTMVLSYQFMRWSVAWLIPMWEKWFYGKGVTVVNVVQIDVGTLLYICKPISTRTEPNL